MPKVSIECKKLMVKEISERINNADTLIVTSYKGLNAQELNELRRDIRNISAEYLVVKDSLLKKALEEGPNNAISGFIEGEVGVAVGKKEDPAYISKLLVKFSKDHEVMKICGGIIKGTILSKDDISSLASLPDREVLLGKLANVLNSPIQNLAGALHGILSKLVYALDAVKNKRQGTGDKGQDIKGMAEGTEKSEQNKEA